MGATEITIGRTFYLGVAGPGQTPETLSASISWSLEGETIEQAEEKAIKILYEMADRERRRRFASIRKWIDTVPKAERRQGHPKVANPSSNDVAVNTFTSVDDETEKLTKLGLSPSGSEMVGDWKACIHCGIFSQPPFHFTFQPKEYDGSSSPPQHQPSCTGIMSPSPGPKYVRFRDGKFLSYFDSADLRRDPNRMFKALRARNLATEAV